MAHLLELKVRERLRQQLYRAERKDETNNYQRQYARMRKLKIINHYSNGTNECTLCGFDNVNALTLDHIDGNGNKERQQLNNKGGTPFYRYIFKNNFPNGYRVLCWNCNHLEHLRKSNYEWENKA